MLPPEGRRQGGIHPIGIFHVGIIIMAGHAALPVQNGAVVAAVAIAASVGRVGKSRILLLHEFLTVEEHPVDARRVGTGPTVVFIFGIATFAADRCRFRLLLHPGRGVGKLGMAALAGNAARSPQKIGTMAVLAFFAVR